MQPGYQPPALQPDRSSGFIEFSTCGQLAVAAPFFSMWMDIVRLGIIAGVMNGSIKFFLKYFSKVRIIMNPS